MTSCILKWSSLFIGIALSAITPGVFAQSVIHSLKPYQTKLPDLIPYREKQMWGFADSTGTIRIAPKYLSVGFFENGLAQVKRDAGYGLINDKGEEVIKPVYHDMYFFRGGLIRILNDEGKYGALNLKGEEVIPATYSYIRNLYLPDQKYDLLIVSGRRPLHPDLEKRIGRELDQERVLGLYGVDGKQLLPTEFNMITYKGEGIIEACYDRECKYITLSGKEILPQKFHRIMDFKEGIATYCDSVGCGIINAKGEIEAARKYQRILPFSEGLAPAQTKAGDWGYINSHGKLVIPATYKQVGEFKNGFAKVKSYEGTSIKTGIINKKAEMLLPLYSDVKDIRRMDKPDFYEIHTASEGVIEVQHNKKSGKLIEVSRWNGDSFNRKYNLATDGTFKKDKGNIDLNEYDVITQPKHGLIAVYKDGKWGVIDTTKTEILPFVFASIDIISPELFQVKLRPETNGISLFGLINKNGEEVAPVKYTRIGPFINGLAPFRIGDKQGLINLQGKEVIKPIPAPENYSGCGELNQGLIRVCHNYNNNYGYVDRYGRVYFKD